MHEKPVVILLMAITLPQLVSGYLMKSTFYSAVPLATKNQPGAAVLAAPEPNLRTGHIRKMRFHNAVKSRMDAASHRTVEPIFPSTIEHRKR